MVCACVVCECVYVWCVHVWCVAVVCVSLHMQYLCHAVIFGLHSLKVVFYSIFNHILSLGWREE